VAPRREIVTLSKLHFLYLALVLLVVLPVIVGIVASPIVDNVWCRQIEIPTYERQFGFTLGTIQMTSPDGSQTSAAAFTSVARGGWFDGAGVRPGDIPRMHHGYSSLCGTLAAVSQGYRATLAVVNADDARSGHYDRRREIDLQNRGR
jgi:hypothetical protein